MPDTIEIDTADYERFIAAASAAAEPELEKLVQTSIASLRDMDAVGLFGDTAARHLWDEYCWQLQEGPYDDDDIGFGSTSRNFDEVLDTVITGALDELPKHTLLFLSIYTRNDAGDAKDPETIGGIRHDDIAAAVLERVEQAASRRNLDFIGPARCDVIPMEISLGGLIGEALSHTGETSDFLSEYVDQLLAGVMTTLPTSAMRCWSAIWSCCTRTKMAFCCLHCLTGSRKTSGRWCWKGIFAQRWKTV